MNKRSVPIAIASCILVLAGLLGYLAPEPTEANPHRLLLENSAGRVIFSHSAHSTPGGSYGDSSCATCHHELLVAPTSIRDAEFPEVLACSSCHGSADRPDFKQKHQDFYRDKDGDASCVRCHHAAMSGYSEKWNHQEHWDYAGDCVTCHHEEKFEYKPGKFMNIKPQKCSNCHTGKPNPMTGTTIKDAGHKRCEPCHTDLFDSGAKGCSTCHKTLSTAEELARGNTPEYTSCAGCHAPISGGMDAFHNKCMGCHDSAGKGPGKEAPCAQCHTP